MIICISMPVTPLTVRIWPRPTVTAPPAVGLNSIVIWPAVVTNPWMVEVSVSSAGPSLSCATLVPVKAPLVAVASDHSVWSPIGIGLEKPVLGAA